jgi:hypothetical protein
VSWCEYESGLDSRGPRESLCQCEYENNLDEQGLAVSDGELLFGFDGGRTTDWANAKKANQGGEKSKAHRLHGGL